MPIVAAKRYLEGIGDESKEDREEEVYDERIEYPRGDEGAEGQMIFEMRCFDASSPMDQLDVSEHS